MRYFKLALPFLAFGLLLAAGGCGGSGSKMVKVEGKVVWQDGGGPVKRAMVKFIPVNKDGKPASGFTSDEGSFYLTTDSDGDGALPGEYKVLVYHQQTSATMPSIPTPDGGRDALTKAMKERYGTNPKNQPKKEAPKSDIPSDYKDDKTTPLKWTVESGGRSPEFKIIKQK
jgi:hypothetical protein